MTDIKLLGCGSKPLGSYMKALGVLRLLSDQRDHCVRAAWVNNYFVIRSSLTHDELISFFMHHYKPTPIVAPWAGGCGFFDKDDKTAISIIRQSTTQRLESYREVILKVEEILVEENQKQKPTESAKTHLIQRYRRELPDAFVDWFDSAVVLTHSDQMFAPILGTGGNDGRLDFTQNFMHRVIDVGIPDQKTSKSKKMPDNGIRWLRNSLFAETCKGLLNKAIGQFNPGSVGGPNATQGMERGSIVNPWDYVLMMEGLITMAGSVSRKMGSKSFDKGAFPFTVTASGAGAASVSQEELSGARAEVWLPVWNKFATYDELKTVFSEGRIELNGRQSRDGVEIARALATFGADRGLTEFIRYSFLKRSGKAFLAVPVSTFAVSPRQSVDLLQELDRGNWLDRFRKACKSENPAPPKRFVAALRSLDEAIFDYCRRGDSRDFSIIFRSLGRIEKELALSSGKVGKMEVPPLPLLSAKWLEVSNDGSGEFRLATTLASITGTGDRVGPLRYYLEPVKISEGRTWWDKGNSPVIDRGSNLSLIMLNIINRRMLDASNSDVEKVPLAAKLSADLDDIAMFLEGSADDQTMEDFLWSCVLVDQKQQWPSLGKKNFDHSAHLPLYRLYALLKLLFLPASVALKRKSDNLPILPEISILGLLRAGRIDRCALIASRRLKSSGYIPLNGGWLSESPSSQNFFGIHESLRVAASLLIPLTKVNQLVSLTLRQPKNAA